jgi:hypothetical protein
MLELEMLSLEPCRCSSEHYILTLEHEKLSQEPWRFDLEHQILSLERDIGTGWLNRTAGWRSSNPLPSPPPPHPASYVTEALITPYDTSLHPVKVTCRLSYIKPPMHL